jgi:hypothetical protein
MERLSSLQEEIAVDNKLLADRDALLDLLPCPIHGRCSAYAGHEIQRLKELDSARPARPTGEVIISAEYSLVIVERAGQRVALSCNNERGWRIDQTMTVVPSLADAILVARIKLGDERVVRP